MPEQFTYFSDIEEHFCRRRGTHLIVSTLDWALMETWKDAGIPLEVVLRGIDAAFDRYDARPSKTRKINSLAYCAQEVLAAVEEKNQASVGAHRSGADAGLASQDVAGYCQRNAAQLELAASRVPLGVRELVLQSAASLVELGQGFVAGAASTTLEALERRLTVLEEKLLAALLAATSDDDVVAVRVDADRELAPYRRKMPAAQIDQLQKQYLYKRLLERYGLPRLSLFYM